MKSLLNGLNPYKVPVSQTNIIVMGYLWITILDYLILRYLAMQQFFSLCWFRNICNMVNIGKWGQKYLPLQEISILVIT